MQQNNYKDSLVKSTYILDSNGNLGKAINMNAITRLYPIVSNNHPLRNPVVNMLPKILPATLNPRATSTADKTDTSIKRNDSNEKKTVDNIQSPETHVGMNKTHISLRSSSKRNTANVKAKQADELADKNDVVTRSSEVSENVLQISTASPQIRKTTPRLAKMKSAQNMKLMAQALGSKSSSISNTLKSKEKDNTDKNTNKRRAVSKVVSFSLLDYKKKILFNIFIMILFYAGQRRRNSGINAGQYHNNKRSCEQEKG